MFQLLSILKEKSKSSNYFIYKNKRVIWYIISTNMHYILFFFIIIIYSKRYQVD